MNRGVTAKPTAKIGTTEVPRIGLGAMGLSAFYPTSASMRNIPEGVKTLKGAYDLGVTHWDTSDIYGTDRMGENEELIGKALQQEKIPREKVFIASKFGFFRGSDGKRGVHGSPEYVKEAFANSSKALETDYLDLYYQHRVSDTPIEETVKAMDELRQQGKVRYLGLSECSAQTLRRACKITKIDCLQIEYSLFATDIERNGILEACKELGVVIVAYAPLGRGFLSGTIKSRADLAAKDFRTTDPRFSEQNFPKNFQLVDFVSELAKRKGCTNSQIALAWVLAQSEVSGVEIVAIPGTTRVERVKENADAIDVVLSKEELAEIREMLNTIQVAGERYSRRDMALLNK